MKVYILIETRTIDNSYHKIDYKFIERVFLSKEKAEDEKKRLQKESSEFDTGDISFSYNVEEHEVVR